MKRHLWIFAALILSTTAQGLSGHWAAGIREKGGGFYLASPDQQFVLNFRGYGQFLGTYLSDDYSLGAVRPDRPIAFNVRRARLSMEATINRTFEFVVEWGTPTTPTITAAGAPVSNLGIVEAHVTARLSEDVAQFRVGKFIGPFSGENSRSPRNLSVVERSSFINSLIAMPALDTQIGVMVFGRLVDGMLNYYIGAFNGNGQALTTATDINGHKEIQAKIVVQPTENFYFGVGFDTYSSTPQAFALLDHAFVPFFTGTVSGRRYGAELEFEWNYKALNLYSESVYFSFPDSSSITSLLGSMVHAGIMLEGDQSSGVEAILRAEWSQIQSGVARSLTSATVGLNVFINGNYRYSLNYIAELPTGGAVAGGPYATLAAKHILYNQIMVRF